MNPVAQTGVNDLNLTKLSDYFQRYDVDINQDDEQKTLFRNTDIITEDNRVTVAGMLVFGLRPQRHLRNASISFAHYAGVRPDAELLVRKVIEGTLDYQIDTALSVIRNNLREPSTIKSGQRVPLVVSYPEKVFRELFVNSCIHRNYAISGSWVRVLLYQNRIEFLSPGRLPNTVTIEKLKSGVSYNWC